MYANSRQTILQTAEQGRLNNSSNKLGMNILSNVERININSRLRNTVAMLLQSNTRGEEHNKLLLPLLLEHNKLLLPLLLEHNKKLDDEANIISNEQTAKLTFTYYLPFLLYISSEQTAKRTNYHNEQTILRKAEQNSNKTAKQQNRTQNNKAEQTSNKKAEHKTQNTEQNRTQSRTQNSKAERKAKQNAKQSRTQSKAERKAKHGNVK